MSANPIASGSAGASELGNRPDFTRGLIASLSLLTLGSMVAAVGIAKLFIASGDRSTAFSLIGIGASVGVGCVAWLLRALRRMPKACDDCEKYGRHMVGLTFLLLVIGLCNAVGTSSLALDGGLGFSASALIEASNPKRVQDADTAHNKARDDLKAAERRVAAAERASARAEQELERACAPALEGSAGTKEVCETAREQLIAADETLISAQNQRVDAKEHLDTTQAKCDEVRDHCKRALFFLLSLSTMMSLFGASFYVVNQVRSKRPRLIPDQSADASLAALDPASSANPAAMPASTRGNPPSKQDPKKHQSEPFDVHAFWSGAFFRVGEAVLFTFAFFWLIWTSDRRTDIVWLPVLGLFVGMFVKTGEAIIFRLGMRVLSAVEALLPTATPVARGGNAATDGSEPARGEPSAASGRAPELVR